ncbi:NUDIX hydrolase [Nigerium massiliense]|uniref:NUDIX hydrolase n=1 Tax=Nigerium massiliense TaxID=1522317 RepID=UPI0005914B73|nr:NUDIX domain-containing protein [Nigerium massiliense]
MPTPEFVLHLRERVGHHLLWLSGCTAVVFRDGVAGDEILLVKRADDGAWSPVCGIVDPGEEPHEAAVREVAEEAGVVCAIERLVWMSVTEPVTYDNGDRTQYIDHTFRCRYVSGDPFPVDGEATEARFFPVDALPAMPPVHAERARAAIENAPEARLGRDWLTTGDPAR